MTGLEIALGALALFPMAGFASLRNMCCFLLGTLLGRQRARRVLDCASAGVAKKTRALTQMVASTEEVSTREGLRSETSEEEVSVRERK